VGRLLHPFVVVVTAILVVGYAYIATRLTSTAPVRAALAAPFVMVWILPVVYWFGDRDRRGRAHEWVQALSFLCMGWLSFLLVLTVTRDALLAATALPPLAPWHSLLAESGVGWVPVAALTAVGVGALPALRGPYVRRVDIPVEGLAPDLDGFRIVQISDLHAGPTMRLAYVQRVVDMTRELKPDLIALTGDIVDGSVRRLASRIAPLEALASGDRAFFVLGNHDYYSGAAPWTAHFEAMGFRVLRNGHVTIDRGAARLLIGGVIDFAARMSDPDARPRPDLATDGDRGPAFRLLLAHNPKIAPLAEQAGFDLQLSGHTHAGQFFPWTFVIHWVHGPHAAGLSRRGRLWVYVSAGTGTWGPPVRLGTRPEITLLRIVAASGASRR
jgi:predicted MPP superfamily phosphohydrolase